ncbi:MAG: hypothetical protein U9Q07_01740 [Planctomycetota bacterium]|nr:hypothetical protein [Planctomycetota bacterium]
MGKTKWNGSKVREARLAAGLTQESVVVAMAAQGIRAAASQVAGWEVRGVEPRASVVCGLAVAIGCPMETFFGGVSE